MLRLALSEHFMNVDTLLAQLKASGGRRGPAGRGPVKKKRIERPTENKVHTPACDDKPPEQNEGQSQKRFEPAEGVSIELIRSNWQEILASVKGKNAITGGSLDAAEPADWHDNILTMSFPQSAGFARQMCENRAEQIEKLLSEAIGIETKVQFESSAAQADETGGRGQAGKDKKKRDAALSDPAVKTVLSGLNATVVEINEVEE
jgi:hypothetical protein